jgi:hypothetical protein
VPDTDEEDEPVSNIVIKAGTEMPEGAVESDDDDKVRRSGGFGSGAICMCMC